MSSDHTIKQEYLKGDRDSKSWLSLPKFEGLTVILSYERMEAY